MTFIDPSQPDGCKAALSFSAMVAQRIAVFAPWMAVFEATRFASDCQNDSVVQNPKAVRLQRRASRGDVHDGLGHACRRCALRGSKAFDGAVLNNAVRCKKAARQVSDTSSRPAFASLLRGEQRAGLLKIGHRFDIEPAIGNGDDDIGMAEAEFQQTGHPLVGVGDLLADEVFASHAEMNAPRLEMTRDLAGRQKLDRCVRHTNHKAAIATLIAAFSQWRDQRPGTFRACLP